ncbi:type II secretion system minor pseudopilin GspJ [Henriciella sp. AS95]|uniref:type II secretion system minor pseudopilin GspJ n=1 Tax=Henriciella sp. AS95 TaxID=3135782 RepID=UPI00316C8F5A
MTHQASSQSGFTLTETLVALFILSILAVAGGNLLLRATQAGKQVRDREAVIRTLDIAQAFIRDDLEAMVARGSIPEDGFGEPVSLVGGRTNQTDALLRFVRNGWINPNRVIPRSGLQTIRYELTEDGELVRAAYLRPDPTPNTNVARRVLLDHVETVDLVFWRNGQPSAYWEGRIAPPDNVLPDLIDMRIALEDGRVLTISGLVGGLPS